MVRLTFALSFIPGFRVYLFNPGTCSIQQTYSVKFSTQDVTTHWTVTCRTYILLVSRLKSFVYVRFYNFSCTFCVFTYCFVFRECKNIYYLTASLQLYQFLSIYLFIYLSVYLSIYLFIYLSIYLSLYLSIYLAIYLSIQFYNSCRRLPQTKRHSSLFLHW
jgi:hypothetical protein